MVFLAALATVASATYLTSHMFAQGPGGGPNPVANKIGLINMAAVLKGYNKFSVYNNEIEKIRIQYEKQDADLKANHKKWMDYAADPKRTQAEKETAEKSLTQYARAIDDNKKEYQTVRAKKSDEQMVQMWKEVEEAIKKFAPTNGYQLVMHYSEPLTPPDIYSPPNIQRKLVGPGSSGGVCPIHFAPQMDISQDIVNTLNSMYPATPVPMSSSPAQGSAPSGNQ
jgi:Skp family chaperone for outer membrane proteins